MVNPLRVSRRRCAIVTGKPLNVRPVRNQPRLKIVQCNMRMKSRFRADPRAHLKFGIHSVSEHWRVRSRINIRKGDYMVGWALPVTK